MAGESEAGRRAWGDARLAGALGVTAMLITLATNAWVARTNDEAWRRLLEATWGIDGDVAMVLLLVAAPLIGLAFAHRYGGDATGELLVGAGATAGAAGVAMLLTHVLARPSGVGQLVIPTGFALLYSGAVGIFALVVSAVIRRPSSVRAFAATWTVFFAFVAIIPTAAFADNSLDPTPWQVSFVVFAAIVAIGIVNPPARGWFVGVVVLLGLIIAVRWILDDSLACEDDDCFPLPLSAAWLSLGGLLLATKWWRRDVRRMRRSSEAADATEG